MNLCNPLRIALDLDDTIFDFWGAYKALFPRESDLVEHVITRNVVSLRYNKEFWENLPLLEKPNFEPYIYATKRINSKVYTRNCLAKYNLPIRPIYQMYYQHGNKADLIKGKCDVLIDDSISNVQMAINSGLPALLIDRPHNQNGDPLFRIYSLDIDEIRFAYELELATLGWN
jgi:FMN phosphatase YigB (HAD superfamily)